MTFLVVVIVLILAGLSPIASIAALNHLFSLGLSYDFWTWLSMLWVHIILTSNRPSGSSKS